MWPLDILAWTSRLTPALTVVAIPDYVFLVLGFPGACAIVCMLQKFAWEETHALIDLKCFGIKDAVCVVEGDWRDGGGQRGVSHAADRACAIGLHM